MSDLYREILVKREMPVSARILKGALIGLVVLCLLGGIMVTPLLLPVWVVLGVVFWIIVLPKMDVEY